MQDGCTFLSVSSLFQKKCPLHTFVTIMITYTAWCTRFQHVPHPRSCVTISNFPCEVPLTFVASHPLCCPLAPRFQIDTFESHGQKDIGTLFDAFPQLTSFRLSLHSNVESMLMGALGRMCHRNKAPMLTLDLPSLEVLDAIAPRVKTWKIDCPKLVHAWLCDSPMVSDVVVGKLTRFFKIVRPSWCLHAC